jgi:hypothetical protein
LPAGVLFIHLMGLTNYTNIKVIIMKKIILVLSGALLLASCSKENWNVSLTFKGVNQTLKSGLKSAAAAVVVITDFRLSVRDVEFKKDESELDSSEVQFRGPYDIDLMNTAGAVSQTIGNIEVPNGTYKVLRFKLHKSTDRLVSDVLYDRSLYMKGTINGVPFEFWHDTSENFDIQNTGGIVVSENKVDVIVQFNMDQFLNSLHTIDLSTATDGDNDNLIEINPDNTDNNIEISNKLKENIKEAADLIKL